MGLATPCPHHLPGARTAPALVPVQCHTETPGWVAALDSPRWEHRVPGWPAPWGSTGTCLVASDFHLMPLRLSSEAAAQPPSPLLAGGMQPGWPWGNCLPAWHRESAAPCLRPCHCSGVWTRGGGCGCWAVPSLTWERSLLSTEAWWVWVATVQQPECGLGSP